MKKLSNTEGGLKKKALLIKNCIVLNYRFSYFRPFTHYIITKNTTQSNMCLTTIPQVGNLGWGREQTKEATKRHSKESMQLKKWYPSYKFFYVLFSLTQPFFPFFSWSSDSITASDKKNTSKKEPTSVSETANNICIKILKFHYFV